MQGTKDSPEVTRFMALLQDLKNWCDDDPTALEQLVKDDRGIKQLCENLYFAALSLSMNERKRRALFTAPVNPTFISDWRDYEDRYQGTLSEIWLSDLFSGLPVTSPSVGSRSDMHWKIADDDASEQAAAIEDAIDFAAEQASDESRDFPTGFPERILDGTDAWERLKQEAGFDLRGAFRRRELVPFVLVPRHVDARHGHGNGPSLYSHLQQAHDAFVFGAPYAAIALMRSIVDTVLRTSYRAHGKDLNDRINNCDQLPRGAAKAALHRLRKLANALLHLNEDEEQALPSVMPDALEKEVLSLLLVVRALIEGAPRWPAVR